MTRLRLDFDIISNRERAEYVKNYVKYDVNPDDDDELAAYAAKYSDREFPLPTKPTPAEADMMANYILWGKEVDDETGEVGNSIVDEGYVEIENKGKWNKKKAESLDGLREKANEVGAPLESKTNLTSTQFGHAAEEAVVIKVAKANLDRQEVENELRRCGRMKLLDVFKALWREIDYIDYVVTRYQLSHGIRTKEIRRELLDRMSDDLKAKGDDFAKQLDTHRYGKLRRLLIDKRQEQYTLRDAYAPTMYSTARKDVRYYGDSTTAEVVVLPVGVVGDTYAQDVIFDIPLAVDAFRRSRLDKVTQYIATLPDDDSASAAAGVIDFRDADTVGLIVYSINNLRDRRQEEEDAMEREVLLNFIATYDFYVEYADLKEVPRYILECKEAGFGNADTADMANEVFGTTYAQNYISTIFTKQVCDIVAAAARLHGDTIRSMPQGIDSFKVCKSCGKLLLKDDRNFNRQGSKPDGYMTKCKTCNKVNRR